MLRRRAVFKTYMRLVVLKILEGGPRHAYGVIKGLEELTGVRPSAGAVYPVLNKLIREGLVSVDVVVLQDGRDVKTYRLTDKGLNYLKVHEGELKEALRTAESLRKLKVAGCDRLLVVLRELVAIADKLSEEDLMELKKAVADFEARAINVMSRRGVR
ncbi:MAG: PadR family transcriptional regulator [Sulfolobales archaeon]